ncbi:MAG: hypothetical protein NC097_07070 [Clostridium sp.]|nr:hypothetical protein [Clostridium sp.]MCM1476054.1 hypothetical protein [Muribaculaceae bacterium]
MMAKRLLGLMLAIIVCIFVTKAEDPILVYDGITPIPGSEISSFNFVLNFDLSKVIENSELGEYGVGWTGYHNDKRPEKEKSVTIYKGDPSDGIVIGRVCDSNYNGKTSGFEANPEVNIEIVGAIPEPGVTYTMVICNEFTAYLTGSSTKISTVDFFTKPITYTFIGGNASSENLSIAGCSITASQSIDELTEITFNFTQPVSINQDVFVEVLENDKIYAKSTNFVLSDDRTAVTYYFDKIPLRLNHSYVISLPDGAVYSEDNTSNGNQAFTIPVTGTFVDYFKLKSSTPSSGDTSIFSTVDVIFDMPDGFQVYKKPEYALNLTASLFKEEIAEDNLVTNLEGSYNTNRNGIVWTNKTVLEPGTTYILYKPKGEFRAYELATDKFSSEWYNDEVLIVLNTPSIEESGISPIELENPVIGTYQYNGQNRTLNSGDKVASLSTIEFIVKNLKYSYNGELYSAGLVGSPKVQIFDITDNGPVLLKEVSLLKQTRETTTDYYVVYPVNVNSNFFEGHRYRLVVPAGSLSAGPNLTSLYISNQEYAIEFEGSAPTSVELISCTIAENEELQEISAVEWKFKGDFVADSEKIVRAVTKVGGIEMPTFVTSNTSGETTVQAFYSYNGKPLQLKKGEAVTILLPEGLIYYAGDPSIKNKEYRINIIGAEAKPEVQEPEFVAISVDINGFHSTSLEAVKGRKLNISLIPDGNWVVTSLTRDGNDVLPFLQENDGVYTTPALTGDTKIAATIEYDGVIINDIASDVVEIPETSVKVYSDGEHIVVDGINVGDVVAIYSTNGMKIAEQTMNISDRAMQITIAKGQIYIVRVNDKAVKIQH